MCVLCVNVSNRARNSRKPQSLYVVYIPFFFVRVDYVVETPNPSTFFAQPSPSLLFFFLFSYFPGGVQLLHTHTHFYGRISSSSSYSLPCPVFLLLKIYGFTILEKYLGPLVSGRLLKKKENCWVERTRAFDLSGHNVRPLRSRRDVFFYLQPLQGNNKNIGSQKKNDNETFPERIVHRVQPSCGWEPCDSWTSRDSSTYPPTSRILQRVARRASCSNRRRLTLNCVFGSLWGIFKWFQADVFFFFFFLVPCASFDTDATAGGSSSVLYFVRCGMKKRGGRNMFAGPELCLFITTIPSFCLFLHFVCVGVVAWMFSFVYNGGDGAGPRLLVYWDCWHGTDDAGAG